MSYWLAFFWGFVILASFVGWGSALNRFLFPARCVDWGQRAAWGMALSVVVGGVLNLLQCISRTTVLVYLGLGIVWWLAGLVPWVQELSQQTGVFRSIAAFKKQRLMACGFLFVVALALIQYRGSVSTLRHEGYPNGTDFNAYDDFQAYIVFPTKMLQVGSLGHDPFNGRRLESSLGGQSFLHTFVLGAFSAQNLHIIDPGLGLLIVIGLLLGDFKDSEISPKCSIGLLLFLLLVPAPTINTSSLYTGMALFVSLYRTLAWKSVPESRWLSKSLVVALTAAAICSLKSSFIPALVVLLACSYLYYLIDQGFKRDAILETASAAFLVAAFTLPWMISLFQSSGTLLYPLLGSGYHQSAYGNSLAPYGGLTFSRTAQLLLHSWTDAVFIAFILIAASWLASRPGKTGGREAALFMMLGAAVGSGFLALATGEPHLRLAFPFVLATILVALTEVLSSRGPWGKTYEEASAIVITLIASGFLVGSYWDGAKSEYVNCFRGIWSGTRNYKLVSNQELEEYKRLQMSVPAGKPVLAWLDEPFLLDFGRNSIFVMDMPGESSLPPGIPLFKGSEELSRYLLSKSIQYVAYSYGDRAGIPEYLARKSIPAGVSIWRRTVYTNLADVQGSLEELGERRKHIYDDGKNFVLDVRQVEQHTSNR